MSELTPFQAGNQAKNVPLTLGQVGNLNIMITFGTLTPRSILLRLPMRWPLFQRLLVCTLSRIQ